MLSVPAIDRAVFYGINHGAAMPSLDAAGRLLTYAGEHAWILAPLIPFLWRRAGPEWRIFWALLLPLLLLSDSIPNLLKAIFERDRPFVALGDVRLLVPVERLHDYGFPSNHATNSFAVAALAVCTVGLTPAAWLLIAAAFVVSLSRVYIGVHYPLDISAGALLGCAIACLLRAAHRRFVETTQNPGRSYWRLAGGVAAVGAVVQLTWRLVR